MTPAVLRQVDHLVFAVSDLDAGIARIEMLVGVRASAGGQHPGRGTRNALIALGPASYLEIIGPDPDQPKPDGPRPFGIDDLKTPRLVTWAAKGTNLDQLVTDARTKGVTYGLATPGSRRRPDGVLLTWRTTNPADASAGDGLMPFFIDWGASAHPSASAATGATLVGLRAEHPEPDRVLAMLRAVGVELPVTRGPVAVLVATIAGPKGRVELR
ncbi:MAG TPA: VOC family protein [Vicinamibacterales bacterium]|nr:VOC family protein [Vicinamibacterales bacterium]